MQIEMEHLIVLSFTPTIHTSRNHYNQMTGGICPIYYLFLVILHCDHLFVKQKLAMPLSQEICRWQSEFSLRFLIYFFIEVHFYFSSLIKNCKLLIIGSYLHYYCNRRVYSFLLALVTCCQHINNRNLDVLISI